MAKYRTTTIPAKDLEYGVMVISGAGKAGMPFPVTGFGYLHHRIVEVTLGSATAHRRRFIRVFSNTPVKVLLYGCDICAPLSALQKNAIHRSYIRYWSGSRSTIDTRETPTAVITALIQKGLCFPSECEVIGGHRVRKTWLTKYGFAVCESLFGQPVDNSQRV
jgi:hypothetical protein